MQVIVKLVFLVRGEVGIGEGGKKSVAQKYPQQKKGNEGAMKTKGLGGKTGGNAKQMVLHGLKIR